MKNIFGELNENNYEQCEKLIYWITIFEEKKILKRKIKKEYPEITDKQIKKLLKLNYSGWSRISKKMLVGLKAYDGENIIEKLEKTSLNFMQIINKKEFGFNKKLEELMPKSNCKLTYNDVDEIPTSPANKRAIWQTICVVKEITKVMKNEPNNIYIEFAKSESKKKMKDARVKQLLKKYEEINNQIKTLKDYDYSIYKELKNHQIDKTLSDKLYLYFIQNGKCLYSREPLNLDELNTYEIDHIMPQSYIKDDSIDNKALVIRKENQGKKDNLLLSDEIINKQSEWWKSLLENGLISQTKYFRLIKRKMFETDDDKDSFIKRQLVETRQITKYVTNLLNNEYKNAKIFAIRAKNTHEFRSQFKIYKNRNINNFHHAHDAYILSIIGNVIDKKIYMKNDFLYSEYVKRYNKKEDKNKVNKDSKQLSLIMKLIRENVDLEKVYKVMNYKDCYISRMLQENTGSFYNQTLYSPKQKPVIPLKRNKSAEKYGGYSNENKAYCTIFEYTNSKNKREYELIGIPIQVAYEINQSKQTLENYISKKYLAGKEFSNLKILKNKILINQEYFDENNEIMRLCSDKEIRTSKELIVNNKVSELVYLMNLDEKELNDKQIEKVNNEYLYLFNYFIEKIENEYKVFTQIANKIKSKTEYFKELSFEEKKSTINGIINLMETGQGNLKSLGLGDREGRMSGKTFKGEKLLKMTFINKSVTGMYERRYKINGMENSCN